MTEIHEVKRALISCFDKTGVVDFARDLSDLGIEIVSSGGTALEIANAGIKVITVEDVTGKPIKGKEYKDGVELITPIK